MKMEAVSERQSHWMRRLKMRHLEVFMVLARTGSQSITATSLNVTQPALSKWLRELEEDVGCPLFARGRPLKLTVYGQLLSRFAERVLGDSLRVREDLEALRAGRSGIIRVGVLRTVAATLAPRAVIHCRRESPYVQIALVEDTLDILLPKLERRELDCVIGRLPVEALNTSLFSETLYDEPVCAVARAKHPLLRRNPITLRDAAKFPWIVPSRGTPMRHRLDAEFSAAGLGSPPDLIESSSLLCNEKLLQQTDMISVLSRELAGHYVSRKSLSILPLDIPSGSLGQVGLLWADKNPTAAVKLFLEIVRAEALSDPHVQNGKDEVADRWRESGVEVSRHADQK